MTFWVAKSTTENPLKPPNCANTHLVEPSGFVDIAIGEGAGLIRSFQAMSLVRVSITFIMFAGGLAPRLDPAITYLPSGVTLRSWMPPLSAMVLTFSHDWVLITSTPPVGCALICGKAERSSHSWAIAT